MAVYVDETKILTVYIKPMATKKPSSPLRATLQTSGEGEVAIIQSVTNICPICVTLQWTVCQDPRAHSSTNEALTSLSHLIKEGTIIILLKRRSER